MTSPLGLPKSAWINSFHYSMTGGFPPVPRVGDCIYRPDLSGTWHTWNGSLWISSANIAANVSIAGTLSVTSGSETVGSNSAGEASIAMNQGPASAGSGTGFRFQTNSVEFWRTYMPSALSGSSAYIIRDQINGRTHVTYSAGATSLLAATDFASSVYVGGQLSAVGNLSTSGSTTSANDVSVTTAGQGLKVKEGSNAKSGVATLVAGVATVSNTSITAISRIQVTSQVDGGTPGYLRVSARVVGTSFTVRSGSATDTSTFAYFIVEPS